MQGSGPSRRPARRAQGQHLPPICPVVKVGCCRNATTFCAKVVLCRGFVTASALRLEPSRERPDPWSCGLGARQAQGARRARRTMDPGVPGRSEEHTSELQSRPHLVCRLLLEKKK